MRATVIAEEEMSGAGETVMRSGAYRPQVSGAPVAIPTQLSPRLESPRVELIVAPQDRHDTWVRPPPRRRHALAIVGLFALAAVSFVIALAARSPSRVATRDASVVASADAARGVAVVTPLVAPVDAPVDAPLDAPAPPPDAAEQTTILDLRTTPPGATVRVGDQVRTAPARFALPAGHYVVFAELDGYQTREAGDRSRARRRHGPGDRVDASSAKAVPARRRSAS